MTVYLKNYNKIKIIFKNKFLSLILFSHMSVPERNVDDHERSMSFLTVSRAFSTVSTVINIQNLNDNESFNSYLEIS